jgi:pSer/pThr/pTyr-binding forkhead associated (FHA) protein
MYLRLKVVKGKPRGHCLAFPNGEFMFGRGPECDVRPNSDLVSRQHCLLQITAETVTVRDLGSMNGTLVNGQLLCDTRALCQGDTLQIGPLVLEVILDANPQTLENSLSDTMQANVAQMMETPSGDDLAPAPPIIHAEI